MATSVPSSPLQPSFEAVFMRVYRRALELASLKGWLHVHGAVVGFGDHRVAIVGPSSAGKTTLAIGLLCEGANVEVDETFFTRDREVVGVARRFHVKPGTLTLMNSVQWLVDAPMLGSLPIRAVDPTEHGFTWDLPVGPLRDLVVLRRTDGPSRLESARTPLVVQEFICQVLPRLEPRTAPLCASRLNWWRQPGAMSSMPVRMARHRSW